MAAERAEEGELEAGGDVLENESALRGPQFNPPLYVQRYEAVLAACKQLQAAKVVDVGCAECKLLRLLIKQLCVRDLVGVDIQASLLQSRAHRLLPLITDYVLPRHNPLTIRLMQGSIAVADQRLVDFDLLSCVEVIEHLDPPVLNQVPAAIFGQLQPKMVVMTTPNSEFNVLFPSFHGFRHPDHRFEWTRCQFQTWCQQVCTEYPSYSVEFSGVGQPPPDSSYVGYCSQMATFTRTGGYRHIDTECGTPYQTVMECQHPHRPPLPLAQRLRREAEYRLLQLARWREEGEEEEEMRINLEQLLQYKHITDLCTSVEDIREALGGSEVVCRVEGREAVLQRWRTDSSDEEEEDSCCSGMEQELEECEPENWD